jgi:polyphenol oxidase
MKLFRDFFPPEISTLFSDRSIDGSLSGEQHGLAPMPQEYFTRLAGFPLPAVFNIKQVHGDRIISLEKKAWKQEIVPPQADGLVTDLPNVPLVVRTADCFPVFIYDPKHHCLGLVHAGWRGTEKGIVPVAIRVFKERWGSRPEDLRIALGPGIRKCCYQVGEEFKNIFPQATFQVNDQCLLDLPLANKTACIANGVLPENIHDCGLCTCCHPDYFSYRREGMTAGRHISLMIYHPTEK